MDKIAKEAHSLADFTNIPVPYQESITSCRRAIWNKWKIDRATELQCTKLGSYREENKLEPLDTSLKERKLNTSILRLRIGHCSLRHHLHKLKIEASPNCDCGQQETIDHVILNCPKYYTSRVNLRHSLYNLGVPFQL